MGAGRNRVILDPDRPLSLSKVCSLLNLSIAASCGPIKMRVELKETATANSRRTHASHVVTDKDADED